LLHSDVGDDSLQTSEAASSFGLYEKRWDRTRRRGQARTGERRRTRENPENSTKPAERRTARRRSGEGEQGGSGDGGDIIGWRNRDGVVGCRYVRVGGGSVRGVRKSEERLEKDSTYLATSFYFI
jgi:hypothetical protein